jgi:long-chain acyl-CoA synthetase
VANAVQTRHWLTEITYGQEVWLSVVPIMHSYGMTNAMNIPIVVGATMILLPVFEPREVLEHIREYYVSIFPGVPSMYMAINQALDVRNFGLSSINACISGAAPLPVEVQEAFEKLTRGRLVEGYGLSEASPVTHANPLFGVRKPGSIGIPIPNTDARIVQPGSTDPLPPGQIGELVVRGPQVMMGYWQEDGTISPDSAVRDGWLYTGDIAVMDSDGYFTILSRQRDAIPRPEGNVFPRDVEEVIYELSKVLEVAVVGVPGPEGEQVKAVVVPRSNGELTREEILRHCRRRLAAHEVPDLVEFREELPKSFVGKVLRRLLVDE